MEKSDTIPTFYLVNNALQLDSQMQITQCIHVSEWKALYISYHRNDQSKMITKIIDMRKLKQLEKVLTMKKAQKYLINLIRYIKTRHFLQYGSKIPSNILEIKAYKSKSQQSVIYLTRPFIQGHCLNNYILTKNKILDQINLLYFINQLISIQISFQGIKQHVLTSTNIFIDENFNIQCNFTSMVGIGFIEANEVITKQEFYQIFPYLYSNILKQDKLKRNNLLFKIKGIVVNLLKLILKEQFNLLQETPMDNIVGPSHQKIEKSVSVLKELYGNLFKKKQVKKLIFQAQKKFDKYCENNPKIKKIDLKKMFKQILEKQFEFSSYEQFLNQYFYNIKQDQNYQKSKKYFQKLVLTEDPKRKTFLENKGLFTPLFYIPIKWNIEIKLYITKNINWYSTIAQKRNGQIVEKYAYQIDNLSYFFLRNIENMIKQILSNQILKNEYFELIAQNKGLHSALNFLQKKNNQISTDPSEFKKNKKTDEEKKEYVITEQHFQKLIELQEFFKDGFKFMKQSKITDKLSQYEYIYNLVHINPVNILLK